MKKRVGMLYGKPIIVGDKNLVTQNEIHVESLKGPASEELLPIPELVNKILLKDGWPSPESYSKEGTLTFEEGEGYHLDTVASSGGVGVCIMPNREIIAIALQNDGNGTGLSWANFYNQPDLYSKIEYPNVTAWGGGYDSVGVPKISFIGNVLPKDFSNNLSYMQEHYPENILIWDNL